MKSILHYFAYGKAFAVYDFLEKVVLGYNAYDMVNGLFIYGETGILFLYKKASVLLV